MQIKDHVLAAIKNQITEVEKNLTQSKVKFAESCLNEDEWQIRSKYEKMCKVNEGQIQILEKLQQTLEGEIFVIALPMVI